MILTQNELELMADFLEAYSDRLGNDGCNDYVFPENWTDQEKTLFIKEYHDFNGDPEEYIEGATSLENFCVASLLAFKVKCLASSLGAE
jgi:hypothetical protein